jgi:hypothetical protein
MRISFSHSRIRGAVDAYIPYRAFERAVEIRATTAPAVLEADDVMLVIADDEDTESGEVTTTVHTPVRRYPKYALPIFPDTNIVFDE